MTKATLKAIALAALAVPALTGCGRKIIVGEEQIPGLSPAAAAAVEKRYSGMLWTKTERERARGMVIHEVEFRRDGKEVEVEVAPDGTIMEIETKVSLADLPEAVAAVITAKAGGRKILEIEKEETLAAPRLVKLESPLVFYKAKAIRHLWYRKLKVRPDGTIVGKDKGKSSALPAAAAEALKKAFPDATFEKIEREREGMARLHEVKLRQPGREIEVKLAPDGTVVEVETKVDVEDLPEAAAEVVRAFARFAIMLKLEKKEVFARTAPVRLPKPGIVYEAEIRKSFWREQEIQVAPDGKVVKDTDG